jgi:hypothetical protein
MNKRHGERLVLICSAVAVWAAPVPAQTPKPHPLPAASQDAADQKLRAHRLWGAPLADPLDFKEARRAYNEEGKREVLDMWAAMPMHTAQSLEEIQALVVRIPLEATVELSESQQATLLETLSDFLGLQMLPTADGVDRLITFHTARGGKENFDKMLKLYRRMAPTDTRSWTSFRDLLTEIWRINYVDGPVWLGISPENSLIAVRDISSIDQLFDFNKRNPLGSRVFQRSGGSLFFDAHRTLEQALDQDGTVTVAAVTILVHRRSVDRLTYNTYPVIVTFHWEPSVGNWILGEHHQEPIVRGKYETVPPSAE